MNQFDLHLEHVVSIRGDEVGLVFLDCGGLQLLDLIDDVIDAEVGVWNTQGGGVVRRWNGGEVAQELVQIVLSLINFWVFEFRRRIFCVSLLDIWLLLKLSLQTYEIWNGMNLLRGSILFASLII